MTNLLDLITPTNLLQEKEKFFESTKYNPVFHYVWQDARMEPEFSVRKKYALWEAIRDQDYEAIVQTASDLFEVQLSDNDLLYAESCARQKGKIETGSASEYAARMREALNQFGLTDFQIEITNETGFNSRPKHQAKKLIVSSAIHFEYFSMEGGVHHELVHILRYINGKHNRIKRSQRFLPTEEGLASWCQDHTNDDNGQAQHAVEYVASYIGVKGSLRDVYNSMIGFGMSQELAWKRACRHKFGFVDTSQLGDILKPAMYFANEMKIDKLSTNERLRLFVGKINQDELPAHPVYAGLWPAEQLIEYFHL